MMLSDVCLSDTSVAYIRSAGGVCGRPAGWRVLADRARLSRPGSRLPQSASVAGLGGGISWRPPILQLVCGAVLVGQSLSQDLHNLITSDKELRLCGGVGLFVCVCEHDNSKWWTDVYEGMR